MRYDIDPIWHRYNSTMLCENAIQSNLPLYISFDQNGSARKFITPQQYNSLDPSISKDYVGVTENGEYMNNSGQAVPLSARNFSTTGGKNLLAQIQQQYPSFLSTQSQQPQSTQSRMPQTNSTALPKGDNSIPSWMQGTTRY